MTDTAPSVPASAQRASFEREAVPHLNTLYRFAVGLAHDADAAEDLVQNTMLRAYRSWHQYRSGTNIRAWLLTILRNVFINEYRRGRRMPRVEFIEQDHRPLDATAGPLNPEDQFFDALVDEEVLRAVRALPEEFRETLVLSDFDSLSYQEIATITDVPVGTVKSRLFRARRLLRRALYAYAVEMGHIRPPGPPAMRAVG